MKQKGITAIEIVILIALTGVILGLYTSIHFIIKFW